MMKKSKKLIVYQNKANGTILLCPTHYNKKGRLVQSKTPAGKALGKKNLSNSELGKAIKQVLSNECH
ncbi:MAG TPA: hypothetical protein VI461_17230 [Chitinophagaceae bacterium]|nr:hypothetical protein [Chitinophagaceae bacterium]